MAENITIAEVAKALGVSKSTVSRAISGKGRISAETVDRVQQYIARHGYKPNAVARGLAQQRTFNIGVVCPIEYDVFNLPFFHKCLRGISEETAAHSYDVLLAIVDGNDFSSLKRSIEGHKMDGVILTRTLYEDPIVEYLLQAEIPFVTIGRTVAPEVIQVDIDHIDACRELTSILLAKGFQRLALIGSRGPLVITDSRYRGFLAAYENAGIPTEEAMIYLDTITEQRIAAIVDEILRKEMQGIICMDEKITTMVMAELKNRNVRVPQDIRLASFYNSKELEQSTPAITAIDVDDEALGSIAVKILLRMIEGDSETGSRFLKNYQVMMRESTI